MAADLYSEPFIAAEPANKGISLRSLLARHGIKDEKDVQDHFNHILRLQALAGHPLPLEKYDPWNIPEYRS